MADLRVSDLVWSEASPLAAARRHADPVARVRLRDAAEKAKIDLSSARERRGCEPLRRQALREVAWREQDQAIDVAAAAGGQPESRAGSQTVSADNHLPATRCSQFGHGFFKLVQRSIEGAIVAPVQRPGHDRLPNRITLRDEARRQRRVLERLCCPFAVHQHDTAVANHQSSSSTTGAWSEGRSSLRGALSTSHDLQCSRSAGETSRWSMRRPKFRRKAIIR